MSFEPISEYKVTVANLIYEPNYITTKEKELFLSYFRSLYPIWEMRFSESNPPPEGQPNRSLLRPVYWLGNWQFACLNYYHPPKGTDFRCVQAEEFPPFMDQIVKRIEDRVHSEFLTKDLPRDWHLNTCLINYYGDKLEDTKWTDMARVGEHKDFEPGPVASLSFGDKALFQFVASQSKESQSKVMQQQWLEDSSLQIFGGDKYKKQLFHRVQRVEKKHPFFEGLNTEHFRTRRINLTFRYVPKIHVQSINRFPVSLVKDILPYIRNLSEKNIYWRDQLDLAHQRMG